jgi:hypothetical protein
VQQSGRKYLAVSQGTLSGGTEEKHEISASQILELIHELEEYQQCYIAIVNETSSGVREKWLVLLIQRRHLASCV